MSYRFPAEGPLKPARVPVLRQASPYCSECTDSLIWDDDSYLCPTCGTSFQGDEDGEGIPYPDWSGESYAPEPESHDSGSTNG